MDHDDSTALLQAGGLRRSVSGAVTPVIGLTRHGDPRTKLRAFDLGVDDILTVPFSPEELLARSMVVSRRATGSDRSIVPVIRLGEMEIDIVHRQVRTGTSIVTIWGTDFVAESNVVHRHVRGLRAKLQNDDRHPRFIATVPGRGYRFIPTFTNVGWDGGPADERGDEALTIARRPATVCALW